PPGPLPWEGRGSECLPLSAPGRGCLYSPSPFRGGGWGEGSPLSPSPPRGGGRGEGLPSPPSPRGERGEGTETGAGSLSEQPRGHLGGAALRRGHAQRLGEDRGGRLRRDRVGLRPAADAGAERQQRHVRVVGV